MWRITYLKRLDIFWPESSYLRGTTFNLPYYIVLKFSAKIFWLNQYLSGIPNAFFCDWFLLFIAPETISTKTKYVHHTNLRKMKVDVRSLLTCFLPFPESVYDDLNFLDRSSARVISLLYVSDWLVA